MAATDELVERVDAVQYETGEGPCLEAIAGHDVVRASDLAVNAPWPKFAARRVAETGVRGMASIRLFLSGDARAALNFYTTQPSTLDELDISIGAMLAPSAAMAVQSALKEWAVGHLETALHSSRQIGTAIGILMTGQLITSEQAFGQLVTASQHLNRKLRDVADEVEHTGAPAHPAPTRHPAGRGAGMTDASRAACGRAARLGGRCGT